MAHVSNNSGKYEWYTPGWVIDRVRGVLGPIALDPASSARANEIVGAEMYYTEDGESRAWASPFFCNPPYNNVEPFIDQALATEATGIFLTNNATETKWGQKLLANASGVCFPAKRIRFLDPKDLRPAKTPLQGQMIVLIRGDRVMEARFRSVFTDLGIVLRP